MKFSLEDYMAMHQTSSFYQYMYYTFIPDKKLWKLNTKVTSLKKMKVLFKEVLYHWIKKVWCIPSKETLFTKKQACTCWSQVPVTVDITVTDYWHLGFPKSTCIKSTNNSENWEPLKNMHAKYEKM